MLTQMASAGAFIEIDPEAVAEEFSQLRICHFIAELQEAQAAQFFLTRRPLGEVFVGAFLFAHVVILVSAQREDVPAEDRQVTSGVHAASSELLN